MPVDAAPTELPAGFRAVPVSERDAGAALRLCVVAAGAPIPPHGSRFLVLGDLPDALVYLGCIVDAARRIHCWIELWVQDSSGLGERFPEPEALFDNRLLDDQWTRRAEAYRALDPETFITTGWESLHPPPIFFSAALDGPAPLDTPDGGQNWELCVDDALLESAGLPRYGTSLARYLYQPSAGRHSRFIPVAGGAPTSAATAPISELGEALTPFNPGAGLMMVRELSPLTFDEWLDVTAGRNWRGIGGGERPIRPGGVYRTLQDAARMQNADGHFFLARHGRTGRLIETFHLRLESLGALLRLARDFTAATQLPFLNLRPGSFRVRLAGSDAGLPFLWTAKFTLADAPESVALPVETTENRYFLPAELGGTSIFRPAAASTAIQARAEIRLRNVVTLDDGSVTAEGTLTASERLNASENDLLSIRLPLASGRVKLYGHFDRPNGGGGGGEAPVAEARFRTLPQKLDPQAISALRQAEGVVFSGVAIEVLPVLSSPCDLHAIGVLAVRAFLVDDESPLPVALDELLSASRRAAASPATPLADGLGTLALNDHHMRTALGPHRLSDEAWTPDEALDAFPARLWWSTLAWVARLFPGLVPDAFCRNLGDAPPLAIQKAYDAPLAELDRLRLLSRSALLGDWKADREIAAVVSRRVAEAG